ncbi:uncharacterized UPF0160 family protein [Dyadobacter jejuensis]|uniref:Uncharacterized UPF0160 family protein n=1 Tax=Dyadobacter jejuensis TaxID=1082580 RepID=A0A316A962_9BACT|nr:MYG1 family protein [Dyadobacter jejuensis]PWJ53394.1 uncharacterized UPF0160 family protein [Dyadobacter jejuensis]
MTNNNTPAKIITHAGTFHADEVLAVAITNYVYGGEIPIERVFKVSPEDMENSSVFVYDIAGEYNPAIGNFDHHQDGNMDATNMLILNYLEPKLGCALVSRLKNNLFKQVSDIDRGIVANYPNSFNSIIRNYNNMPDGFYTALHIAESILLAYIKTAEKSIEGEKVWLTFLKFDGVAIDDSGTIIPEWRDLAEKDNVFFLVSPNVRGGFQIISRNPEAIPIPKDSRQTFRHNSGFMAVYSNKEDAVNHAKELSQ